MPLQRLREALERRVESMSLRQTAREVGMSPTGLQNFLDGSRPYTATRRKLERWYVRDSAAGEGELDLDAALAAVHVLLQDVPATRRPRARRRLIERLEELYTESGRAPPGWLRRLGRRTERDDPG